jgi:hypothetical protein
MIPRILPKTRILPEKSENPSEWRDASDVSWRLWLLGHSVPGVNVDCSGDRLVPVKMR